MASRPLRWTPRPPSRPLRLVAESRVFTEHVRCLVEQRGEEECRRSFEAFWPVLLRTLRQELARRGLWRCPPRFLGLAGDAWTEPVLEELATDAYVFLLERLRALGQQLAERQDVEGLMVLNLRHFLHERHKRSDPLGFRLYEVLRSAVRQAVAAGELVVIEGSPGIDNGTLLQPRGSARSLAAEKSRLVEAARVWSDRLLPDLVTARGPARQGLVERLRSRLSELGKDAVLGPFSFKDLLDALKSAVKARWQAAWNEAGGEQAFEEAGPEAGDTAASVLVPVVAPDLSYEERESFHHLVESVSAALDSVDGSPRLRRQLASLWHFLRTRAPEAGWQELPSRRQVAQLLGLPRYRLPELYDRLAHLVRQCQMRQCQKGRARGSPPS